VYLFGYSGGGQFVHRYTMAHPDCVRSFVVGAAGWYTFPNADEPFPLGIGESPDLPDVKFEPNRFLAVPGSVLVGERDTFPGTALRKTPRVREEQGQSRFERGRRWVDAMNAASAAAGLSTHYTFESLSRSPHSFAKSVARGDMAKRVFERLFGPAPQQTQSYRFD
jgi:pimeloyl-ACP methyl ester carboxylesterase